MLWNLLLSILGIILTIFIVVGVHESAHFFTARLVGIKVLRFSIGFGKALYRWTDKKGTEFVLAPLPLGGYVKLLDENEGWVAEHEKHLAFNRQPIFKRMLVVIAGPVSNLVLAVLLYWLIFMIGFETPIPLIGSIEPHSIASEAGLKPLHQITAVDGHPTHGWQGILMRLIIHAGDQDTATIELLHQPKVYTLNLKHWEMNNLKPDPLSSIGIIPYSPDIPLVIGKIKEGSPAAAAQLKVGDKILLLEGKPLKSWDALLLFIDKHPDTLLTLTVGRDHQKIKLEVLAGHRRDLLFRKHGFLGLAPVFDYPQNLMQKVQDKPLAALVHGFKETVELSYLNLVLFGKLVTNKISIQSMGGPLTIFESAGTAFQNGLLSFLGFLAFLNVALGIINIFPIPGLDGGHLLFQAIEAVTRRPVSLKIQMLFYRLGFIFLVLVLLQALSNDVMRIWGA